ncbi:hypothetical protein SAMN05518672_113132 [Chitinophaga sp. CF118]|uniref:hypothetical protein n=1 Tax=Chitinophaga sp. CF118 TaxID=1884367 RepID=UPI0008E0422E|nr:hypothetical protein [Chitinophaga sp. CF118]SFE98007.1 hypothetical protein SAMN05518672_113132 [Chitinophaga sp. CF118]
MTMIIRYALFLFLFVLCLQPAKAQFQDLRDQVITEEAMQRLKERTVVFVLPKSESPYMDDYANMLSKVWTITPIKIVNYKDVAPYLENVEKYAFLAIGGIQTRSSSGTTNTHYYLTLSVPYTVTGKKTKVKHDDLCRIELYPEMSVIYHFSDKEVNTEMYSNSTFRNFTFPYMTVYLKFLHQNLKDGKRASVFNNYEDKALLSKVKNDTLYIPEELIYSRNKFTGKEREKDDEDLFSEYPGKYKIVSNSELINIIRTRDESKPIYLFEYVLSSTDKYVGVLDVRSGKVIYRKYTAMSYNLKPKDIRKIID